MIFLLLFLNNENLNGKKICVHMCLKVNDCIYILNRTHTLSKVIEKSVFFKSDKLPENKKVF